MTDARSPGGVVRLGDLSDSAFTSQLAGAGLVLDSGVAITRVRSSVSALAPLLKLLYQHWPWQAPNGFFDIHACLERVGGLRRWLRPQVAFVLDGKRPFEPFPADTHLPLLEWGINWAIAHRSNTNLLLHAGVLERGGRAILLPALPGSGKSTLTAAMTTRGFRLLSDEFGPVRLSDGMLVPALRPVALKNESIDVIRDLAPGATIGPVFPKTRKGRVAHLAPDAHSVANRRQPAVPALVVFPRYVPGTKTALEPIAKAQAFTKLAANSFNYEILGRRGFHAMLRLIERCACYRITYSSLEGAIVAIGQALADATIDEHRDVRVSDGVPA